jgi:hypothetical protein
MDDAYIIFRYASHFAAGQGLVFNTGEQPRAEGIISPLYAIMLSLASMIGTDITAAAKWLGLLAAILTAGCIWVIVYTLGRSLTSISRMWATVVSTLGAACFLSDPYVAGNAVSGMETSIAALVFSGFLFLGLRMMSSGPGPSVRYVASTGFVATLVVMFRPEMGLSVVMVLVVAGMMWPDRRHLCFAR